MALLVALLVAFEGFPRTFLLKGAFGAPEHNILELAQGLVMTLWFACSCPRRGWLPQGVGICIVA